MAASGESAARSRSARVELSVVALLTAGAYLALWVVQRSLWTNGFDPADPFALPRVGIDSARAGRDAVLVVLLGTAVCALFLWLVLRSPRWDAAGLRWFALAVPAVVATALFLAPPTLSIDAYSYLSHGYLAGLPGSNPYVDPSASVAGTPYGQLLGAAGWLPVHPQTPYGPLWTLIERLVVAISGHDVRLGVELMKLVGLLALVGTGALVYGFLGRVRPERRLTGSLLLLANPLVLVEFAGDGHNDGLMVFFVVLALVACERGWPSVAIVALTLAVLVKATPVVLALPMATYLVVQRRSWRRLILEAAGGVLASAALTVGLFAPYWVGPATLGGLRASGTPGQSWSVSGWLLDSLGPSGSPDGGGTLVVQAALGALLLAGAVASCFWSRTPTGLIRSCGALALLTFLLLPVEWPWYAALPAAILPLAPGAAEIAAVALLALGSRLIAGIGDEANLGVVGYDWFGHQQALVGQTIPGLLGLLLLAAPRLVSRRRPDAHAPSGGWSSRSTRSRT